MKKAVSGYKGTELDPHGRIDMAGKPVPFYPSARGAVAPPKTQASAHKESHRATPKKSQ